MIKTFIFFWIEADQPSVVEMFSFSSPDDIPSKPLVEDMSNSAPFSFSASFGPISSHTGTKNRRMVKPKHKWRNSNRSTDESSFTSFVFGPTFTSSPSISSSDTSAPVSVSESFASQFSTLSLPEKRDEIHSNSLPFKQSTKNKVGSREETILEDKFAEKDNKATYLHSDSAETKTANVGNTNFQLILVSRILKGIPQSPHFYQLRNYSETARKFLMTGWDRVFEETIEGIHILEAKNFWVRAKEMWKTMEDLQGLGYNVILMRRRLVELSDVMMELKFSKRKILGLKERAEYHRMEKSRLEYEIMKLEAEVEREQGNVEGVLNLVVEMEKELPRFDGVLAELAMKPLEN